MEKGAPALLRYREAAIELACSVRTVRRLVAQGHLDRVYVASGPRVPRASVARFVAEHAERATPHAQVRVAELCAQGRL